MYKKYKRILIVNTFGIGDVLFSTPLLKVLKDNIQGVSIDYMCNERAREILNNNEFVRDIIIFEKDDFRNALKKSKLYFIKKLYNFIRVIKQKKYDLAIDLSLGYHLSLLLAVAGIKKRIGFNYRNRGRFLTDKVNIEGFNEKHAVEYYMDVLKLIGISDNSIKRLSITVPSDVERWADDFIRENKMAGKVLIGLAPGGGRSWGADAVYRRWYPENFSYVAKTLLRKNNNLFFLILGAKDERDLCKDIEKKIKDDSINLCGRLAIIESTALIRKCKVILCNDGGILHMAVSQKVGTVSIFGPVDSKGYGPYPSENIHKVMVAEGVACRPCYRSFRHKICNDHICLKKIDVNKVLEIMKDSIGV